MNAILSRRKTGAVILAILVIFLMANIIVQSIHVQKANASVALAAYLVEHGLAYLALLLGVGGVVYADLNSPDWSINNPVDAFVNFVTTFYEENMQYEIMNTIEALTSDGSIMYNEIPQEVRHVFLDFAEHQAAQLLDNNEFGYITGWEGDFINTPSEPAEYVYDIPSLSGMGFTVEVRTCDGNINIAHGDGTFPDTDGSVDGQLDRWTVVYNALGVHAGDINIKYHMSDGSSAWVDMYLHFGDVFFNEQTGDYRYLYIQFTDDRLMVYEKTPAGMEFYDDMEPNWMFEDKEVRFTGHTDVGMYINDGAVTLISAAAGTITGDQVIDDGTTWREENAETLEYPVIPPWVELGQETINLPVGGIDSITGEGVDVGDITTPVDTTVDYPVDYPDTMTGVGDVPLDIPNTASGSWINKLNFDWTTFANVTERFPLSIPWDIQRVFALFNHYEAEPPEITFNLSELFPNWSIGSDQEYSISFEFIEPYVEFIRWMLWILMVMAFVIFLLKHYIAG